MGRGSHTALVQLLIEEAGRGDFDLVYAEALDRTSRDQEDAAGFFKRMTFAQISIVTLAEGEISELHVGLKVWLRASSFTRNEPQAAMPVTEEPEWRTQKTLPKSLAH